MWSRPELSSGCPGVQDLSSGCPGVQDLSSGFPARQILASRVAFLCFLSELCLSLKQTFELTEEVENICHQYINTIKLGEPNILSFAEMQKILEKIKSYKKG